jgi:hypothetical protein
MNLAMLRKRLQTVVPALALAFTGVCHGALFNSHFDPVEFFGDGQFQLDDACLVANGGFGIYSGAECHVSLLSAVVDITRDGDHGLLDFAAVLPSTAIFDIQIADGALVGVNTDWIGWTTPGGCDGNLCDTQWWIRWTNPLPGILADPVQIATCAPVTAPLRIVAKSSSADACDLDETTAVTAYDVTFTRVPEPGTLLLLAGGLFAGWQVRRRRG